MSSWCWCSDLTHTVMPKSIWTLKQPIKNVLQWIIKCQTKCHLQKHDTTIYLFILFLLLFLQYLFFFVFVFINKCLLFRHFAIYDIDIHIFKCGWSVQIFVGAAEIVQDSLMAAQVAEIFSVSFSPYPDVIYILNCARCFLAALVYLPITTASPCLQSHNAAFGVFPVYVYTEYSLMYDGKRY